MELRTHLWCLHGRDTTVKVSLSASPARQREGEQPRNQLHEKKLSFYFNGEQPQGRRKVHKAKLKSKDQEQTTTKTHRHSSSEHEGTENHQDTWEKKVKARSSPRKNTKNTLSSNRTRCGTTIRTKIPPPLRTTVSERSGDSC